MRRALPIAPLALAGVALAAQDTALPSALPSALEAGWHGQRVCEQLHESATHRVLKCTFPPGVGHERHFHPPHFGYALSGGTMRITDANGTREANLATGSQFSRAERTWHEVVNVGETTVAYLIVEER